MDCIGVDTRIVLQVVIDINESNIFGYVSHPSKFGELWWLDFHFEAQAKYSLIGDLRSFNND